MSTFSSLFANLPDAAIELAIGLIIPILLPALPDDAETARAIVARMLADYEPRSLRELQLAAEATGFSLKTLVALARSSDPVASADRQAAGMKLATTLSRAGHAAQRKLDLLRRGRQASSAAEPASAEARPAEAAQPADVAPPSAAATPDPEAPTAPPAVSTQQVSADLAQAELAYHAAAAQLTLMQARYKGAPPPHSQAAQQIKTQQRVVDMARLKLEQVRRRASAEPAAA